MAASITLLPASLNSSEHRIYLEPLGGAASVLLNKQPLDGEACNDLDPRITRLFRVLRDLGQEFANQLAFTPYSEAKFEACADYPAEATDLDKALCDFVKWRQSFSGQGTTTSCTTTRAWGGIAGDVNAPVASGGRLAVHGDGAATAFLLKCNFTDFRALQQSEMSFPNDR